jgi:tryptophanyl-tRNA synthetase
MTKPVILTGLRSNNDLHIGNYLGALMPIINMQVQHAKDSTIHLFVPDLHSFTTPIDHSVFYEQTINNLRIYVAAGLDLDDQSTHIYRQSFIPAHSELTIILNCFSHMGELNRMTQFKEKADNKPNISVGLFDYPVLMASDILLYDAKYVPVGADQSQHLELTRDIAIRMNNKFGELFTVPEPEEVQAKFANQTGRMRIRDLINPEKKMSKSDETGKGVIFLTDDPEAAAKKVMGATTDSYGEIRYDKKERPGISNLLDILAAFSDRSIEDIVKEYDGQTQYGPLKSAVADTVRTFLADFQGCMSSIDDSVILNKLESSEKLMNEIANKKLLNVQKAIGLRS